MAVGSAGYYGGMAHPADVGSLHGSPYRGAGGSPYRGAGGSPYRGSSPYLTYGSLSAGGGMSPRASPGSTTSRLSLAALHSRGL